ncbi:MAG: alanyl-tRNA editing protein [Anaerolineae bacterium]|nr:alanyl-tRNA editing protein [Caldilineales bacterium]MDW8268624.1 alanyl-tRNA editing protein [Anaerolineae bacterium]
MSIPPTRKLYWADPLRRRFTARVLWRQEGERPAVVLNRTLFYPTGGGQPHDTGRLGGANVLGVEETDGVIVHYLDRLPAGDEVDGELDWPRRWDHMQQHSGQHLLSAAFLNLLERPTIGFHLGAETVTIDLPGPPPDPNEVARVEAFCAAIIAENRPITATIVPPEEVSQWPLRKPPTVDGPVRVVTIAGVDHSACGGTHVPSTAAIGSVVILRLERRGKETRVHFLCGGRAWADHRRRLAVTQTLAGQFTTGLEDLPAAVARLRDDYERTQKALREIESQWYAAEAACLWAEAPVLSAAGVAVRLICRRLPAAAPFDPRRLLMAILALGGCIGVVAREEAPARWAIGRSADLNLDLRQLLPRLGTLPGLRGGGSADLLQGSIAESGLNALFDLLPAVLREHLDR